MQAVEITPGPSNEQLERARVEKWDCWIRTDLDRKAVAEGCWFDWEAARRVRKFFKKFLRHSKGKWKGKPFILLPWQRRDIIYPLFGWKRADGTRRHTEAYIEVPKKNGKSALMSGIEIYCLIADGENGAEVYTAAADRDQASIIYNESANMVEASEALLSRLTIVRSQKRLVDSLTASFMRALSAESKTKEGLNSSLTVFDELHAQTTRVLWDTLYYAGLAREQPLLIVITTAGWNKQTICWEQHEIAVKVIEGVSEDWSFLAVIYAASEDDDWTDPEVWKKANPSLGHTIKLDKFVKDCKDARDNPVKQNAFMRYRLNIWTEQETRWLPTAMWDACDGPVDAEALVGQTCIAGLDLSTRCDITALVLLFRDDDIESDDFGVYSVLPYFWIPEEMAAEKERKDSVPYTTWARQGLVEMTPGNVIDYEYVKKKIGELADIYKFAEIGADPWHATQLLTQLIDEGRTVSEVRQGFQTMGPAMIEFEALIRGGKIAHGGHPVLRWMFSNLAVATNAAGDVKPDKDKAKEKIDGISALLTALSRWIVRPAEVKSIYEDQGITTV